MDIEFATRKELIQELMSRSTFTGVIVTTVDEIKEGTSQDGSNGSDFVLACKNLNPEGAIDILEETIEQLRSGLDQTEEEAWE